MNQTLNQKLYFPQTFNTLRIIHLTFKKEKAPVNKYNPHNQDFFKIPHQQRIRQQDFDHSQWWLFFYGG